MKIQLVHIEKNYTAPVLKDLSYTFEEGKLYVIKGVSGCGKTTLLNLIGGLDTPSRGEIVTDIEGQLSDHTGYIFQNSLLISKLTVMENLLLIKNAPEEICSLGEQFGVESLLSKYPAQISGGERQRIAIIRALLKMPQILLADEPTASLDDENSAMIAETIAKLCTPDRIVIVSTHESYFDAYADEIIYLHYGTIESSVKINPKSQSNRLIPTASDTSANKIFSGFRYALRRNPKLLKIGSILPLMVVFLAVLLVFTVQANFSNEYLRRIKDEYPLDIVSIIPQAIETFEYKDQLKIYGCYTASEGEYQAYYLPDEKDSIFRIDGLIADGTFPKNDHEILASYAFLSSYFGETEHYDQYVGKQIVFLGNEFTISGTVESTDGDIEYYLMADQNYSSLRRTVNCKAVFIPYNTLKLIGEQQESVFVMGVFDGLYENKEARKALEEVTGNRNPNSFYAGIEESQQTLNWITEIFVIVLLTTYIVGCIFILTIIHTELFHRRRELGYLQIFGLGKKRIIRLILSEHLLKIIGALIGSIIVYMTILIIYAICCGAFLFFNGLFTIVIIALLCGIYLTTVYWCVRRFLKKNVFDLIT